MKTTEIELLPEGKARTADGRLWQRAKWDGPNYSYRTPINYHDTRDGFSHDCYLIEERTGKIKSPWIKL